MVNFSCLSPNSSHYTKLQVGVGVGGLILSSGAVTAVFIPAITAVTTMVLPIALGIGALIAWVTLLALSLSRCCNKKVQKTPKLKPPPHLPNPTDRTPKNQKKTKIPSPNIKRLLAQPQEDPSKLWEELNVFCEKSRRDFIESESVKTLNENNQSYYQSILLAAESLLCEALERGNDLTDRKVIKEIQAHITLRLDELISIAGVLLEDKISTVGVVSEDKKGNSDARLMRMVAIGQLSNFFAACADLRDVKNKCRLPNEEEIAALKNLLASIGKINEPLGNFGENPMVLLAKRGSPIAFVKILADEGTDFNFQETYWGNTALIWAIANAHNSMANEIMNYPQNFNLQDKSVHGNTALHLAVAKGYTTHTANGKLLQISNFQLVEKLLACGARPNIKNKDGFSPLQLAVIRRSPEMVKALLNAGATIDFNKDELLSYTYEQAKKIIDKQAVVAALDEIAFDTAKAEIQQLLT